MSDPFGRDLLSPLGRPNASGGEIVPPPGLPAEYPHYLKPIPFNTRDVSQVLLRHITAEKPKVMRWLYSTWNAQADALKYQEIRNAIRDGELPESVFDQFHQIYANVVNTRLVPQLEESIKAGGSYMAGKINNAMDSSFRFTITGQRTSDWIKEKSALFVTNVEEAQHKALQGLINHFTVNEPISVEEFARIIRPVVGYTHKETSSIINYRMQLRKEMLKINPEMTEAQLLKATEHKIQNYAHFLHRRRALRIAITETSFAHNFGQFEAVRQAKEQGFIPFEVVKEWFTHKDERDCPFCGALHGQRVDMEQTFPGLTERIPNTFTPPAHPSCRCTLIYAALEDTRTA